MSFEGYTQRLCMNGHQSFMGVYWDTASDWMCEFCGAPLAWAHQVDGEGRPITLTVIKSERTQACEVCDHNNIVEPATYKIPT